jgi:hypothetical protein
VPIVNEEKIKYTVKWLTTDGVRIGHWTYAIANSHTLQLTTAYTSSVIFTGCLLVTASYVLASAASVLTSLLAGDCLTTNSYSSNCRLKILL